MYVDGLEKINEDENEENILFRTFRRSWMMHQNFSVDNHMFPILNVWEIVEDNNYFPNDNDQIQSNYSSVFLLPI